MAEKLRILVGGGTGFVGRRLNYLLKKKGFSVTNISRTAGKNNITWVELTRAGLPDDCYGVVNLAGQNLLDPKKRFNSLLKEQLRSSRIDTTSTLVEAITAAKVKPKVFVSTSAVGFYEPSGTAEYTEESEGGNFDFLSELCRDWEAASKLPPEVDVRKVIVRLGVVLGREAGVIQQIYPPFWMGIGGKLGSGDQWFPWIHAEDAAGIYAHAITNDNVSGILNGVSPNPVTNTEFTKAFGKAMWRPTIFPVPSFALNLIYGPERAKAVLDGQKVIPKRTLQSGYKFVYPEIDSACVDCSAHMPPTWLMDKQ